MIKYLFSIFIAGIFFIGCDEELPPSNNPTNLFVSEGTALYYFDDSILPTGSYIDIYLIYKNYYDEILNDNAAFKGVITIEWLPLPEDRGAFRTIRIDSLTFQNIFFAKKYNFNSNELTLEPKDSIKIRYRWNLKTDDSTNIITQIKYSLDKSCLVNANVNGDPGYRLISGRHKFRVSAKLIIFDRGGVVLTPPFEFYQCWVRPNYGNRGECTQINPYNPCGALP